MMRRSGSAFQILNQQCVFFRIQYCLSCLKGYIIISLHLPIYFQNSRDKRKQKTRPIICANGIVYCTWMCFLRNMRVYQESVLTDINSTKQEGAFSSPPPPPQRPQHIKQVLKQITSARVNTTFSPAVLILQNPQWIETQTANVFITVRTVSSMQKAFVSAQPSKMILLQRASEIYIVTTS